MKKISVLIPCYNEEQNVEPMSVAIENIFAQELPHYACLLYASDAGDE